MTLAAAIAALALAGCGGGERRHRRWRRRPRTRTRRRPGRCGCSPTATRCPTRCSTRSGRRTPTLDLKVATFDSNKAAAAKLAGGFEADVVEVCTDEMEPLLARGLLRPLDPTAVPDFDELAFSDSPEVRNEAGEVLFVPASAGPHGLIVNTEAIPDGVDSYAELFDPPTRATSRSRRRR